MKKILLYALVAIAGIVAGLCIIVAMQPNEYSIERSTVIAAPPDAIFPHVNDLEQWSDWSPWKELDPDAKMVISTPSAGTGANFAWSGNDKVGEGTLTILESQPPERIEVEQVFARPMVGSARMIFSFTPEADGTQVTWRMQGENGFLGKAMCLFMSMEKMIGPDFERGLASIKRVVEAEKTAADSDL
jgi:uncharacterized protein YndB with AHSA1/START domain